MAKDPRDRRFTSVDSQEEQTRVGVRILQRAWSPRLKMDGVAVPWNASIRDFQRGHATHIAEALEQLLFLPRDMEVVRKMR